MFFFKSTSCLSEVSDFNTSLCALVTWSFVIFVDQHSFWQACHESTEQQRKKQCEADGGVLWLGGQLSIPAASRLRESCCWLSNCKRTAVLEAASWYMRPFINSQIALAIFTSTTTASGVYICLRLITQSYVFRTECCLSVCMYVSCTVLILHVLIRIFNLLFKKMCGNKEN